MGAGQFGGINIALASIATRNRGCYGGGLPPENGKNNKVETIERSNGEKVRFRLEPYLSSSGYGRWHLYMEVDATVGLFWWRKKVKHWDYIDNYADYSWAMDAARHLLRESKVVEL
jgi:hypothetical protein